MKIVITGATSFIGVPMVKELLQRGNEVIAVVRPGTKNLDRLPMKAHNLTVLPMQLEELHHIGEFVHGTCDNWLHLGWDGAGSENRTNRVVQQKNVEDSLRALEGASLLGCKRFLFSGSQAEYGICDGVTTEETPCMPVSEYGKAKVEFSRRAKQYCQGLRASGAQPMMYLHTRIFSVYGEGDHPWSLVESCIRTFKEGREMQLGPCTQLWNFLYLEDLLHAFLALLSYNGGQEIFNIAGLASETLPLREYVEKLYELCGKRGSYVCGERKPNAEGTINLQPDISRMVTETGWCPVVSFEEGIRRMLNAI